MLCERVNVQRNVGMARLINQSTDLTYARRNVVKTLLWEEKYCTNLAINGKKSITEE